MYEDLKDLKKISKFNWDLVKIDNWVFRLHYVVSVIIFVGYSGIVTLNTYVGDPIDCIHHGKESWNDDDGDYLDWSAISMVRKVSSTRGWGQCILLLECLVV